MLKDIKNVIISFGLIGLVFGLGSSAYQEKSEKDQALAVKIEELQKIKDSNLAKAEQDKQLADLKLKQKNLADKIAIQKANEIANKNQALNQAQTAEAQKQATLLVQQQAQIEAQILAEQKAAALAQAQLLAKQKAAALAKAQATVTPSRQSKAS